MAINLNDLELLVRNNIEPLPDKYSEVTFDVTANTVFIEILFEHLPSDFDETDAENLGSEIKDRLRDLSDYIVPNGFYRYDEKNLRLFFTHNYCV